MSIERVANAWLRSLWIYGLILCGIGAAAGAGTAAGDASLATASDAGSSASLGAARSAMTLSALAS